MGKIAMEANDAKAPDGQPKRVCFLLVPGFAMLAYACAIEPLRVANHLSGRKLYQWWHVTPDGSAAHASNGMALHPNHDIADTSSFDYVIACSSDESASFRHGRTLNWLRRQAARGAVIGGIGGGAFVLARAGLLEGYRATLHWAYAAAFSEVYPNIELRRSLYEFEGSRMTCAGGMSALDMMHALLAREHGTKLTSDITDWFIHTEIREGENPQRRSFQARLGIHHPGLLRVLEAIDGELEDPLSRSHLAQIAGLSERQLDRVFLAQVGTTIGAYYGRARLRRAQQLLLQTTMPIIEIATGCGFASASSFSKAYRAQFGRSPSTERRSAA